MAQLVPEEPPEERVDRDLVVVERERVEAGFLAAVERVPVVLAFTLPCGLAMGLCFPLGLALLARRGADLGTWNVSG